MTTSHRTDDQLSAQLDGALDVAQAEAATAHLAACESCSARYAALVALEGDIDRVLAHDPGEAYFASFAGRVSARIAAESAPAVAPRAAAAAPTQASGGWWSWLQSPRGLAFAGGALAFAIAAALAVKLSSHGPQELASLQAPQASREMKSAPSGEMPAPAPTSAAAPSADAGAAAEAGKAKQSERRDVPRVPAPAPVAAQADDKLAAVAKKEAANVIASPRMAAPGRAQEMRTLENGEQVPVSRTPGAARLDTPTPKDANGGAFQKPRATPMGTQGFAAPPPPVGAATPAAGTQVTGAPEAPVAHVPKTLAEKSVGLLDRLRDAKRAAPPVNPADAIVSPQAASAPAALAPRAGGAQPVREEELGAAQQAPPMALRLCGRIADPQGRAIAGAVVSVTQAGTSATSDADGSFCVDSPDLSGTVRVFAVGYEPYRYTIRGVANAHVLTFTLTPVPALGAGGLGVRHDARLLTTPAPAKADPFAGASSTARIAIAGAEKAEAAAAQAHAAGAWSLAATQWTQAATLLKGAAAHEGRFRAAAARMQVLPLAPDAMEPRAAARAALKSFLATAPKGAERDQAQRWLEKIR